MKRFVICVLITLFANSIFAFADSDGPDKNKIANREIKFETIADVDVLAVDSMVVVLYDSLKMGSFDSYINDFIYVDSEQLDSERDMSQDSIYKRRLEMMESAINLPYNPIVRNYINSYIKARNIGYIFGLAMYYMPIFEEELYKQGLPVELKILPVVESMLKPNAISPMGAAGLWQFMYGSGKAYGLEINSFVDDRFDPIKSTQAACRFLKDLYKMYNDWTLVLAAYNCGPGNVNKAIKRAGNSKSYWDIYHYLPYETRGYVPAFIAMTYSYTFHKAHNVEVKMPSFPITTDTVHINGRFLHFEQIASTIDVPLKTLRDLNPRYKRDIVPALNGSAHITLPASQISNFIEKEEDIYAKSDKYLKEFNNKENITGLKNGFFVHKVKSGEVLGIIARKYKVKTSQIMKWNNIKSAAKIRAGQKLRIYL